MPADTAMQVGEHDRQGDPDLPEPVERKQRHDAEGQHATVAQNLSVAAKRGAERAAAGRRWPRLLEQA